MGTMEKKADNAPKPVLEAKSLEWISSAQKDLMAMPQDVRRKMGFVLRAVQQGGMPDSVSPFEGSEGNNVLKIKENYDGDTYRLVFAAKFEKVIYVLHAFQKKSTAGRATPQNEIDIVKARYNAAKLHYRDNYENTSKEQNQNGTK